MIKKSWTLEECSSDAKKYSTRSQWADANRACYNFARKNSWLDKCCTHMPHREGVWTEEDCKQLLIHYGSPRGWAKKHYRAYKKAESLGLFKDYDYQNGQAKPKPVINISTGETFKSVKVAAKSISVPASTLHSAIIRKTICAGSLWGFVN